jgi:hypothetical protein
MKLSLIPLQYIWTEMNTCASKKDRSNWMARNFLDSAVPSTAWGDFPMRENSPAAIWKALLREVKHNALTNID